ncbi:hypothetical protein LINPERPRIM_LOCUS1628, partial [Linum perenne]
FWLKLPRRRPTTLRAYGVFARRSLPVVPSSPLAVWAGCPSMLVQPQKLVQYIKFEVCIGLLYHVFEFNITLEVTRF